MAKKKKKTIKQKGLSWLLEIAGANAAWNKTKDAGSGYGTYLSGAGSILTGAAILWAELQNYELSWILSNMDLLKESNGVLLITAGFLALFMRRSNAKLEGKLDDLNKK